MAKVDRSLVADLPLFAGFSAADLDAILSEARSVRVARNSPVFQQGEEAHSFFVLLHGHVRAWERRLPLLRARLSWSARGAESRI